MREMADGTRGDQGDIVADLAAVGIPHIGHDEYVVTPRHLPVKREYRIPQTALHLA